MIDYAIFDGCQRMAPNFVFLQTLCEAQRISKNLRQMRSFCKVFRQKAAEVSKNSADTERKKRKENKKLRHDAAFFLVFSV